MSDDLTAPRHPLGYRVPDSLLERVIGCPVYWSIGTVPSVPTPAGPNILDLLDPAKRAPRERGQRQRPSRAARRLSNDV